MLKLTWSHKSLWTGLPYIAFWKTSSLTSPILSSLVYVSIRPKPISESDCLRHALVRGPSSVGEIVSTKLSGNLRSAGSDNLLLISSWLLNFLVVFCLILTWPFSVVASHGDTPTSSDVPDPSSDSPSLPRRGCS